MADFTTGNPMVDAAVKSAGQSNTLDLNTLSPTTGQYPVYASNNPAQNFGSENLPINQVFIQPDPSQKQTIRIPGQPELPATEIWNPDYINQLKQQAHAKDMQMYAGQNGAKIDEQYSQYLPNQNQQAIYDQYKTVTTAGTTAKRSIESLLNQFTQVPPEQIGYFPGKEMLATSPLYQTLSPEAYNYESQKSANAPQLKDILSAGGLRLNVPEINNMNKLLPSVANNPETNKNNVLNIESLLLQHYGTSLDKKVLDNFGITQQDIEDRMSGKQVSQNSKSALDTVLGAVPGIGGSGGNQKGGSQPPQGVNVSGGLPDLGQKSAKAQQNMDSYLNDSQSLAKQAVTEVDPQKKSDLLAQSRILSNMADEAKQEATSVDPITYHLAKIQNFLADSPILPIALSTIGGITGGPVGAAAGGYAGKEAQQQLQTGGLQAFLPNADREINSIKSGLTLGAVDLLFFGAGKLLQPIKSVTALRAGAAEKATETGARVLGDDIVKGVQDWASNVPASMTKQAAKFAQAVEEKYAGQVLEIDKALAEKTASWGRVNMLKKINALPTIQQGENEVANLIRNQLPNTVRNYDKVLHMMYATQDVAGGLIKGSIGVGKMGLGLEAVQGLKNILTGGPSNP